MADVEVYYYQLTGAADTVSRAVSDTILLGADLRAEDTGIENPADRPALRLEMHRRLVALYDTFLDRIDAAGGVQSAVQAIADNYNELDMQLTGEGES